MSLLPAYDGSCSLCCLVCPTGSYRRCLICRGTDESSCTADGQYHYCNTSSVSYLAFTFRDGSVVQWLGRRTCDREIASSTPGRCIAGQPSSTQPSIPPGQVNRVPACGLRLGRSAFTCVGQQVTLCDPIWQVTSRGSVMGVPLRAKPYIHAFNPLPVGLFRFTTIVLYVGLLNINPKVKLHFVEKLSGLHLYCHNCQQKCRGYTVII